MRLKAAMRGALAAAMVTATITAAITATITATITVAASGGRAVAGPVLDRIVETGEVRFGFRTDAPPFASLEGGRPMGFTVDLCALVAAAIKETAGLETITARFAPVGTGQRFDAIEAGEIDVLCGATTVTLSRRERVSFSLPVFLTGVSVVMRADAPELAREVLLTETPAAFSQTVVDTALKGLRFGVRRDSTASAWLGESGVSETADVTIEPFELHDRGVSAVQAGEIDAYFADRAILLRLLQDLGSPEALVLSSKSFTHEPYALALPRGDDDFRLLIDRALSSLYRDGAIMGVLERHFGPASADVQLFYLRAAQPE